MKLMRFMGATAVATGFALALAGVAAADEATISTTGADSTNKIEYNNSTTVTSANTNVVVVDNKSVQFSSSGDVTADKNTTVSGAGGDVLSSGAASNNNTTSTNVTISTQPVGGLGGSSGGMNVGDVNGASGNGGGNGGAAGQPAGGRGGSVLGATTGGMGGGAILPVTGPSSPVDVSALRAAWQPKADAPTTGMVKKTQGFTTAMLVGAALLSLLGAFGSAVYARRKEGSV